MSKQGPNPSGLCMCGCGKPAPIAKANDKTHGHVKGQPLCFIRGHGARHVNEKLADERAAGLPDPNPSGLCLCGCGAETPIASRTHIDRDGTYQTVKGKHMRFINGHNRRLSPVQYLVNEETGCWEWQRHISREGYGRTSDSSGRSVLAHRVYYEAAKGPIPADKQIDHLCRNRRCVNPDHLEAVTPTENVRRSPRTQLTPELARRARELRAEGMTYRSIRSLLGVSKGAVDAVLRGETWTDCQPPTLFEQTA